MTKGKAASLVVCAGYLASATIAAGGEGFFRCLIFLILPMACIWFSEAMGSATGFVGGVIHPVTRTTPGPFVYFGGWMLLLLPVIVTLISRFLMGSEWPFGPDS